MTRRVIVLDAAEKELIAADAWYEDQRPGLGGEFRLAIHDAMERLADRPAAAPIVKTVPDSLGARNVHVKRFPYAVVFIGHDATLWVVAVAHQHRRPGYWRQRIE